MSLIQFLDVGQILCARSEALQGDESLRGNNIQRGSFPRDGSPCLPYLSQLFTADQQIEDYLSSYAERIEAPTR